MIVYLDSSVILGRLLDQKHILPGWGEWSEVWTSELTWVECFRKADHLRLQHQFDDHEISIFVQELDQLLGSVGEIALDGSVLRRASQSYPTVVGTLDAMHLASAVLWQEETGRKICFLTHDIRQGLGAKAMGLETQGFKA